MDARDHKMVPRRTSTAPGRYALQRLKHGYNAMGVAPIAGRVSGTILSAVADLAETVGSNRIRFTPYQKLIVLDLPDDRVDELVAGLDALGLPSTSSHRRRNLMACSGIEFCTLSFARPVSARRCWRRSWAPPGRHQRAAGCAGHDPHQRAAAIGVPSSRSPTSVSRAR